MSAMGASISWFFSLLNFLRHVQISPFSLNFNLQRTDEIVCPLGLESITIRGLVDYILVKLES